jgi:hypothetical protein
VALDLSCGADPCREGGCSNATSTGSAQVTTPGGVPLRSVAAGMVSVGTPLGVAVPHPLLGMMMAVIELAVILIVLGTALFGSQTLSERAFRLLRWFGNRPEPPGPSYPDGPQRSRHQG